MLIGNVRKKLRRLIGMFSKITNSDINFVYDTSYLVSPELSKGFFKKKWFSSDGTIVKKCYVELIKAFRGG